VLVVVMVFVMLFRKCRHCRAQQQCSGQNGNQSFLQLNPPTNAIERSL
jgi:hypothetical protein